MGRTRMALKPRLATRYTSSAAISGFWLGTQAAGNQKQIAVQGPRAEEIVRAVPSLGIPELDDLKYYAWIDGTHAVSPRQIKKRILTTKTGWWPFAEKHRFDPVSWEADLKRIVRFYLARGFYQARIDNQSVKPDGKDGVRTLTCPEVTGLPW